MLNFFKRGVVFAVKAVVGVWLFFILLGFFSAIFGKSGSSDNIESGHDEGYLIEGAVWHDIDGSHYQNSKKVRVEIWRQKIVAPSVPGGKLTQIYFLEGPCVGEWGYTIDEFTEKAR